MATQNLSANDNGKATAISVGSEILLSLPENPTTGFRWQLDPVSSDVLTSVESTYTPESKTAGGGGTHIFRFKAAGPGEVKLRAKNWREWEGERSVTERFEATVRVTR